MARRKDHPNNVFEKSTRYAMQRRAKEARQKTLAIRAKIPPILGPNTYVLATIAAQGGIVRQNDLYTCVAEATNRIAEVDAEHAVMLRKFRLTTMQGRGRRGMAVMFDETFPLAKEIFKLARKIGECHPIPFENGMPKEAPLPPSPREHRIDLIAGSPVNTLVLATVRALRGKVRPSEMAAAVPHDSLTAVLRSIQRLRESGIIATREGGVYFTDTPWLREIEKLYDAYLRLRPELREQIRQRRRQKVERSRVRYGQGLFGYDITERMLTALAVHGPLPRTKLSSMTMMTRHDITVETLREAGILAVKTSQPKMTCGTRAHDSRSKTVVSLNASFPVYRELRGLLFALAGKPAKPARDLADPRANYDPKAMFATAPLLWALLMMNAVPGSEIDVASLNRLRPQHAVFTLSGRREWLLQQGFVREGQQGLIRYFSLNPDYSAYKPLKRLLDAIGKVWPDLVAAAEFNDELKSERRLVLDRNARKRKAKLSRG